MLYALLTWTTSLSQTHADWQTSAKEWEVLYSAMPIAPWGEDANTPARAARPTSASAPSMLPAQQNSGLRV